MRGFSKLFCIVLLLLSSHSLFIQPVFSSSDSLLVQASTQLDFSSSTDDVIKLQKLLQKIELYDGPLDGSYNSVAPAVLDYQLRIWIISDPSSSDAWIFWQKTAQAIRIDFPQFFSSNTPLESSQTQAAKFIVTAYYSPLPGQDKYATWSYAADIRLNGRGTHGASGKAVHPWFLAAPKNYSFGTKIYIEGLGVWVVEDRGWAIVNAGKRWYEYDRIDVWMWYGDEWRIRAIKWWKRTVLWNKVDDDTLLSIAFDNSPINKYFDLTVDAQNPQAENVMQLQELFAEIWKYNGDINGDFDDIRDILIDFQVKKSVISSKQSPEAWYFGPKTLAALRQEFENSDIPYQQVNQEIQNLSNQETARLDLLVSKIQDYSDTKSAGDSNLKQKTLDSLKTRIAIAIDQANTQSQKNKLQYIYSKL